MMIGGQRIRIAGLLCLGQPPLLAPIVEVDLAVWQARTDRCDDHYGLTIPP
jgi:hypothetical protein